METEFIKELNSLIWKALIISIPSVIVDVFFALAVLRDAKAENAQGRRTVFVGPKLWAIATLIGGLLIAVAYWLMHHSSLRRKPDEEVRIENEWA